MTLEVNGAAVLVAIAAKPAAFGMNEAEVNALATTRLLVRLKDKALKLDQLRALRQAIGAEDLRLALDHLAGKEIGALAKRLDPGNPDLRGADERWQRSRLVALAEGADPMIARARPAQKTGAPAHTTDGKAGGGGKTGAIMKSKALKSRPNGSTT